MTAAKPTVHEALAAVMADRVEPSSSGCRLWRGARSANGYGAVQDNGRTRGAHRWAYEQAHGAIPPRLVIDHLCNVRHCVNPAHLQAVTQRVNALRSETGPSAVNARKDECSAGHLFDEANTYMVRKRDGRSARQCRTCVRDAARRYRGKAANR